MILATSRRLTKWLLILLGVLLVFSYFTLRPVPIVSEEKALVTSGIVRDVFSAGTQDIVFELQDDHRLFYINRGSDRGLDIEALQELLIGNKVILKYPKYWTPIDWKGEVRHVSKLEFGNQILFNELQ